MFEILGTEKLNYYYVHYRKIHNSQLLVAKSESFGGLKYYMLMACNGPRKKYKRF